MQFYAHAAQAQQLERIVGLDPNPSMLQYATDSATSVGLPQKLLQLMEGSMLALPFEDANFDAVVMTLVRALHSWG